MLRCGIIGKPLAHSISPAFQEAAFRSCGIAATYERWETEPTELAARVAFLRGSDVLGANVTIPYKEAVVPLLDDVHDDAAITRAVNTIVRRADRLEGYNTDVSGFARAVAGHLAPGEPRNAVVIGAGGAARAVVLALSRAGARSVAVVNRDEGRAIALCESLADSVSSALMPLPLDALERATRGADVVVNATPVGMAYGPDERGMPIPREMLRPQMLVCDLVANPLETPLMQAAAAIGARVVGGLPMLVEQGAASFELWTGLPAPRDAMRETAERAMAGT